MNENDIVETLGVRIKTLANVPAIYWGNQDAPAGVARPYLRFELNPAQDGRGISGGKVQSGFAQVTVIDDLGEFETAANTMAQGIADLFPYELSLTCDDGKLTITTHTIPMGGFRDGSDWRKPVQIDFIAV
jgi:hypothetical protein